MRLSNVLKRMVGILLVSLSLFLCWSCAYWLTMWLYDTIHVAPGEWVRLLVNAFLGFLLFGCGMFAISNIKWVKEWQDQSLRPLIQAMKMIAEGNFKVDLSYYHQRFQGSDHPYVKVIEGVRHMADKLGEMEEMRQAFISNVSHEIQSPLTSIRGFAHALKNEDLSAQERRHYLNIIETESNRLSKLSENLLKLTSLESDQIPFECKNYRLDHQLRRIVLANEPQWAEKQIHMDVSLEPVTVTANEHLMDQVWINLLHNSIKFTPEAGTITVEAVQGADGRSVVTIRDTGIGMDKHTLIHIFERFYKADPSRNRNAEGNGLGLSIVQKIVDMHKGAIQVRSELGQGTEMMVTLRSLGQKASVIL